MADLTPEDEQAVDRLAFLLLQDAYLDLAAVLKNINAGAAASVLDVIEERVTDALAGLHRQTAEGVASRAIAVAVGAKLSTALDEARGRTCP